MIHILSGRRLQISSSPEQAAPLLPRSGFVQSRRLQIGPASRTVPPRSARDLFEAALNEAACCFAWAYGRCSRAPAADAYARRALNPRSPLPRRRWCGRAAEEARPSTCWSRRYWRWQSARRLLRMWRGAPTEDVGRGGIVHRGASSRQGFMTCHSGVVCVAAPSAASGRSRPCGLRRPDIDRCDDR